MIPKIIHYCWFGNQEKPKEIQEYLSSWSILPDYKIIEWNETNCSFDENEYVRRAYEQKKWAFVSDFYRLKALYEMGGIYLDTDIKVYKKFDPLLENQVFINFIFDCSVGTAVIGAQPGSSFIKSQLDFYDKVQFGKVEEGKVIQKLDNGYLINNFVPNNYFFTYYILNNYPTFKLNNKYQKFDDFTIYPKELFEIGSYIGRQYTIHLCTGSWKKKTSQNSPRLKKLLAGIPWLYDYVQVIVRHARYRKRNKTIPFYPQYLAQKRNEPMPPL